MAHDPCGRLGRGLRLECDERELAQSKDADPNQSVPQKIRDRLAADGYQDIQVAPGSYVVSAKDKNGQRVMMLIGPTSTTMMKVPDNPSTAQVPDNSKDEIIQQ